MNEILKILGSKYHLRCRFNPYMRVYTVVVGDHKNNQIEAAFSHEEAQLSNIDIFAYTVGRCVEELEQKAVIDQINW